MSGTRKQIENSFKEWANNCEDPEDRDDWSNPQKYETSKTKKNKLTRKPRENKESTLRDMLESESFGPRPHKS